MRTLPLVAVLLWFTDSFCLTKPAPCIYSTQFGFSHASCTGHKLTNIPSNLAVGIEALDVSDNKIRVLKNTAFSNLTGLRILYLNDNFIVTVEDGVFDPLWRLEVLDLSDNRLYTIPDFILHLPSLRTLYLSENPLHSVSSSFVISSPSLQKLSIASSFLRYINLGSLPQLTHLNLSENKLLSVPLHSITSLCRLRFLDLTGVKLFKDVDYKEGGGGGGVCNCAILSLWVQYQQVEVQANISCVNDTSADALVGDSPMSCNGDDAVQDAQDLHEQCKERIRNEREVRRNWWIGVGVAVSIIVAIALFYILPLHKRRTSPRNNQQAVEEE